MEQIVYIVKTNEYNLCVCTTIKKAQEKMKEEQHNLNMSGSKLIVNIESKILL